MIGYEVIEKFTSPATTTILVPRLSAFDMDPSVGQEPVPPPGRNVKFDRYVRQTFGDVDGSNADARELRR